MSKENGLDKKTPQKKEICPKTIDRIMRTRTFEPLLKPKIGCRFHYFKQRGETLRGLLGFPVSNYKQGTSYPLTLESGEVVEIVGNKLLHYQIRKGELCGQRIEIVYQGRQYVFGGHYRKIFRIFKIA